MAKKTFNYGELAVEVRDVGEGVAPWDEQGRPRTEYGVVVKGAGGRFKTGAWGSIADFEQGEFDHRGMARMALEDLWSAAADPDGFIGMVIGEARGREALDRGKAAERTVRAAGKFRADALERAAEAAREEEEAA